MSKVYSFNPIPVGLPKEMKSKILGIGCQMWGEFIPTTERMNYQIFPRIAAFAECGWTSQEKKNYERFKRSLPYSLSRWKSEEIGFGPVE